MANVAIRVAAEYAESELDFSRECLTRERNDVSIVGTRAGKRSKGRRGRASVGVQRSGEVRAVDFDRVEAFAQAILRRLGRPQTWAA